MSRCYESKTKKFFKGLFIFILTIGVIVAIGFILNATIPSVHDFFVSAIDWIKNLFTNNKEVVEETTETALSIMK